jgi:hypothetical protein
MDGYEQLRRRVLDGDVSGWRMGLAVVQHRGLAAWLRVRRSVCPPPAGTAALGAPATVGGLGGIGDQLVAVLAGMALGVVRG